MIVQSLDGNWELRKAGSKEAVKATVPGCVHTDLARAKVIEDPFLADNEYRSAWVHETDWEYSKSFEPANDLLGADRVYLECDGLDTIADVTLNGHILGHVDNMYVAHRFDVTDKLTPSKNKLRIKFSSPVNYARPLVEKEPLLSPGDSIPGSIYIRKSPSQWGWDWGPKIPTSGIWRSIRLAGYKIGRIADVRVRQAHRNSGQVTLIGRGRCREVQARGDRSDCAFGSPGRQGRGAGDQVGLVYRQVLVCHHKPKLWWPNGYGDQPLYARGGACRRRLQRRPRVGGVQRRRRVQGTRRIGNRKVGLRTIKIDQSKDKHGKAFAFVVNGVPIFAKGANWIPADQFPSRITDEHYRHLIWSAAKANMNMLRVWGGGIYEDERFYDLCDEYGILDLAGLHVCLRSISRGEAVSGELPRGGGV